MKTILIFLVPILLVTNHSTLQPIEPFVIGPGQMPAVTTDKKGTVQLVYGIGDSLLFRSSVDKGQSFSTPQLITTLAGLNASATRGPQIVSTKDGLSVVATTDAGNIYSFIQNSSGKWQKGARLNDVDSVDLEGFVSVASDGGSNLFAVWLDLRGNRHNKIYGARSADGGKTWSKNLMVYTSPDTTVCQCCKPSVVMNGKNVYVMFRNWLSGNRDLYLIQSADQGQTFGTANKIGMQSWALNGCPMDGGSIVINSQGNPQTVWNRKGTIYACEPGKEEKALGQGRSCTMATVNGENVYAWVENKQVIVLNSKGVKTVLGNGQLPVLKAVNNHEVMCVWENNAQLQYEMVNL
jgi:hypothetical protein